jgi:integrase
VLDWATARKYREGENPARWKGHLDKLLPQPTKLKKVQHRAALPYAEAGAFMAELRAKDSTAAKALELQILTAARPGEIVNATWDEFDLQAKTWTIPAERMKARKEHVVPLSRQAVQLLKELPRVNNWVFPGHTLKKPMTTAAGQKLVKELRPGLTAHGMRSTFRDWSADQTAFPREVIEHALAHQLKDKAEAAYQRSTVFPKRQKLMQAWSDFCDKVPKDTDNVTPIHKGAKS